MDTSRERRRNKRWPEALKREIVAASLAPGASVSIVARQYDVNANQVFSWRRRFSRTVEPSPTAPGLVPVTSKHPARAAVPAGTAQAALADALFRAAFQFHGNRSVILLAG
jgi:transposase